MEKGETSGHVLKVLELRVDSMPMHSLWRRASGAGLSATKVPKLLFS